MKDLIQIVYVSFSVKDLTENDLEELLVDIRKRNKVQKVTGLLLYNDGTFIQLIEGKTGIIQNLYEKIKNHRRHSNVVLLLDESIKKRAFPDWTMGYYKLNREQSGKIPGYSDFMQSKDSGKLIESASFEAMKLLNSFKTYI